MEAGGGNLRYGLLHHPSVHDRYEDHHRLVRRQRQPMVYRSQAAEIFDNKYHAGAVCRELRNLCPRNAEVINIEVARDDPSSEVIPLTFSPFVKP